jgi:hypothetical protein
MTLKWIAARLQMGTWTHLNYLPYWLRQSEWNGKILQSRDPSSLFDIMKKYLTISLVALLVACVLHISFASKSVRITESDFLGTWIGYSEDDSFWRIDFYTNHAGILFSQQESPNMGSLTEIINVYKITNWFLITTNDGQLPDEVSHRLFISAKPERSDLLKLDISAVFWTPSCLALELRKSGNNRKMKCVFYKEAELKRRISKISELPNK